MQLTKQEPLALFNEFLQLNGKRLKQKLGNYNEAIIKESPQNFAQNMQYFTGLNSGGKMLRAVLVNLGYSFFGKEDVEYSDELALSLEIFQSSVLIHDDLLDHGETRRGKDTVHVRIMKDFRINNKELLKRNPDVLKDFTNGFSVALGYIGLYMAYQKMIDAYGDNPNLIRILKEYNDMVIKTVEGGIMDVVIPFQEKYKEYIPQKSENYDVDQFEMIEQLALLKTAHYTTMGPVVLGMILGGADSVSIFDISSIMKDVGLAFQIQDDLLGIYADAEVLGKDVGSDVSECKQTLLYTYVKVKHPDVLPELDKYYGKDNVTESGLETVKRIFKDTGAYKFTLDKMNYYYNRAKDALAEIDYLPERSKTLLLGYIEYLEARRK